MSKKVSKKDVKDVTEVKDVTPDVEETKTETTSATTPVIKEQPGFFTRAKNAVVDKTKAGFKWAKEHPVKASLIVGGIGLGVKAIVNYYSDDNIVDGEYTEIDTFDSFDDYENESHSNSDVVEEQEVYVDSEEE